MGGRRLMVSERWGREIGKGLLKKKEPEVEAAIPARPRKKSSVTALASMIPHPQLSKTKWRRIRKIWRDWCDKTTFHGFNELEYMSGSMWAALFWIVMIVSAFGATAFEIGSIIRGYYKAPTAIAVERLETWEMRLPDVIACSTAGLNVSALRADGASDDLVNGLLYSVIDSSVFLTRYQDQRRYQLQKWKWELAEFERRNQIMSNSFEFAWRYRIHCNSFILGCRSFDNGKLRDCCENATFILDIQYFGCYRLHNLGHQTWQGNTAGIAIIFKTSFDEFGLTAPALREGVALQMVPEDFPYDYYRLSVPDGVAASLALHWRETKLQSHVGQPCINLDTYESQYRQQHSDAFCFSNIWNQEFIRECGCNAPTFPEREGVPNCGMFDYMECFLLNTDKHERIMAATIPRQKSCLPTCTKIDFDPFLTMHTLDTTVLNALRTPNPTYSNGSLSVVEIYYRSLSKEFLLEVNLYSFTAFISNIGGQIGLWCGCSILTVIQGIAYCAKCCRVAASKVPPGIRRMSTLIKNHSHGHLHNHFHRSRSASVTHHHHHHHPDHNHTEQSVHHTIHAESSINARPRFHLFPAVDIDSEVESSRANHFSDDEEDL